MEKSSTLQLFPYTGLNKNGLFIIIHQNPELAINVIKRIKSSFNFNCGDIFTSSPEKYESLFEYKCKPHESCTSEYLQELYARQGGNFKRALSAKDRENLSKINTESKANYLKQIEPLHFLPEMVFGKNGLPDDIYQNINSFLAIPQSYLILHHPDFVDQKFWKQISLRRCITEMDKVNSTMRVISISSPKNIPAKFFEEAQLIFIFTKNEDDLKDVFKKAKLNNSIFSSVDQYLSTAAGMRDRSGLVIQKVNNTVIDKNGNKKILHTTHTWCTTDITRPRPIV